MRVCLTGAESTGKTTLAAALAAHYETVWVPEAVRLWVDEAARLPTYADLDAIARRHLARVDAARAQATGVLVLDTDLVSTVLYARHLFGRCPAWIEAASAEHAADLYLLCAPDFPWVPDPGQRESAETRAFFQPRFEAELQRRGVPFAHVAGAPAERLAAAVAAIERFRNRPGPGAAR